MSSASHVFLQKADFISRNDPKMATVEYAVVDDAIEAAMVSMDQ